MTIQCWRFTGIFASPSEAKGKQGEYFACGQNPFFVKTTGLTPFAYPSFNPEDPDSYDIDGFPYYFNEGTEAFEQVAFSDYSPGLASYGNCEGCQPGYDCINGVCTIQTIYSTPGFYSSLDACNSACGEDMVQFNSISVPVFSSCDSNGNPIYINQSVSVIAGTESSEFLKFQQIADIQGQCACQSDVAAIPDGWLIRPEWHRPQVIYQFAEIDSTGAIVGAPKYPITVPHHLSTKPTNPLPNYQRGNWETIYVLNDNSKITIHSLDAANGTNVLNAIKLLIDPSYLTNAYLSKSSLVVTNNPIAQITVKNRMAKYYSTGAKSGLPDWIVKW